MSKEECQRVADEMVNYLLNESPRQQWVQDAVDKAKKDALNLLLWGTTTPEIYGE